LHGLGITAHCQQHDKNGQGKKPIAQQRKFGKKCIQDRGMVGIEGKKRSRFTLAQQQVHARQEKEKKGDKVIPVADNYGS
jgi:hypothetical protein